MGLAAIAVAPSYGILLVAVGFRVVRLETSVEVAKVQTIDEKEKMMENAGSIANGLL